MHPLLRPAASLALIAALPVAARAQALVVYTPQPAEHTAVVETMAEAALGFPIDFVSIGGGALFDRMLAERNNPQADAIFGLIDVLTAGLKQEGLLQPVKIAAAEGLPERYRDAAGFYYGYRQTPITLSYNSDVLPEGEAPKDWLDLADPKWQGKFMIGAMTWQTTRAILAGLFSRHLDANGEVTPAGWDWFTAFYRNAVIFQEGMNRPQMVASGQTPLSLNHFLGVQIDAKAGGYNFRYIDTAGGTPVVVERNAVVAGTKRLEQATAFVDFATSVALQVELAQRFGVIPVHPEAIAASPAEVAANATLLDAQPIDWELMARKLGGWLERIQLDLL